MVGLAAGQRRADNVDDREALPPAYKQVDHAAVILLLGCSVDGLVEQVREQRVQVTRLDGRKAGAIGHAVQADALGLTQQALFGQDDVQHLIAGGSVGVVHPGRLLGLVKALRCGLVGLQAAQVGDLNLELMALAVDDLHVLPCDLVLLALAVIQKVQCIHLLLHGRFFEKLGL